MALIGFGAWHGLDSVLSHWILGIHRVRMDVPDPLGWDLIWLAAFGLLPALVGGWLLRRPARGDGDRHGRRAAATLGLCALVAGPIAALPPAGAPDGYVVLFAPGVSGRQAFDALARVDARVVWVDGAGGMWVVRLDTPARAWDLHRAGALLVTRSGSGLGCVSWVRTAGGASGRLAPALRSAQPGQAGTIAPSATPRAMRARGGWPGR